jgi:hypothetical protein
VSEKSINNYTIYYIIYCKLTGDGDLGLLSGGRIGDIGHCVPDFIKEQFTGRSVLTIEHLLEADTSKQ